MNTFVKTQYVGNLIFEGSQDGTNYSPIFTVGEEIHEGWNYYEFSGNKALKYRFYRFSS